MLEDLPDFFERHLRSLREAEEDEDPANRAKTSVEACVQVSEGLIQQPLLERSSITYQMFQTGLWISSYLKMWTKQLCSVPN